MELRSPTPGELHLIEKLISMTNHHKSYKEQLKALRVAQMDDGGMGSLKLSFDDTVPDQTFGEELSSFTFNDTDGTQVIATLYANVHGTPYELDMWKTDYSPLLEIPDVRGLV
jgi:hypothetical protein